MKRIVLSLFLVPLVAFMLTACSPEDSTRERTTPAAAVPQAETPAPPVELEAGTGSVAGLSWTVPAAWEAQAQRPMRIATYTTPPPADGDSEGGEVAVFYFGPQEGGTVDANVNRWFNQFDQEDGRPTSEVAERESIEVDGVKVTLVRASGTYNAVAGPMAPRSDPRTGYRLIGAIAEGPEGAVFFKFTGPDSAVLEQEANFDLMIGSIQRD